MNPVKAAQSKIKEMRYKSASSKIKRFVKREIERADRLASAAIMKKKAEIREATGK